MSKTPSNGLFHLLSPWDAYTQRWYPISEERCVQHGRARTRLVAQETLIGIRNIKSRHHFEKTGEKNTVDSNCCFDVFGFVFHELAT